jgi:hypothetical protein
VIVERQILAPNESALAQPFGMAGSARGESYESRRHNRYLDVLVID